MGFVSSGGCIDYDPDRLTNALIVKSTNYTILSADYIKLIFSLVHNIYADKPYQALNQEPFDYIFQRIPAPRMLTQEAWKQFLTDVHEIWLQYVIM